jgi:hypothetical protein
VLAILIPTIWLVLAAFFVLLCRMAARGDEDIAASSPPMARITVSPRGSFVISQPARRRIAATGCRTAGARRPFVSERTAHSGRQRS